MIFTIFSGRRLFCTQAMKNCCSLEFIHGVFLKKRAAIYKIPIKPCVRSLIQRYSVERIRLNKTWMTLKLTKILVSLHCVHSLCISIMSCPSKIPFKFPLPLHKVKIECMYGVLLKLIFSKKATQIDKIFTINLTLTTGCPSD